MIKVTRILLASGAVLALVAGSAVAQENVAGASEKHSELTPLQARALDDWTYSLALQAANWGAPLVTMYNLRYNDAVGPKPKAGSESNLAHGEYLYARAIEGGGLRNAER